MVSMHRRLNSTGRKRIARDRVTIELFAPVDTIAFPSVSVSIDLEGLDLDKSARVSIEAYFRSSSMRFKCGTVGQLKIPPRLVLTDIDRGGAIQFRLLIIAADESGRIVASAEGLRPLQKKDGPEREPLLPLRETDLGEELWRLDLDERNGPWLVINSRVPGLASQLRTSPLVQGLILPHALRHVLDRLPSEDDEDSDGDWGTNWRKFLNHLEVQSEPDDPSDEDTHRDWVEEAVGRFCELRRFADLLRADATGDMDRG